MDFDVGGPFSSESGFYVCIQTPICRKCSYSAVFRGACRRPRVGMNASCIFYQGNTPRREILEVWTSGFNDRTRKIGSGAVNAAHPVREVFTLLEQLLVMGITEAFLLLYWVARGTLQRRTSR